MQSTVRVPVAPVSVRSQPVSRVEDGDVTRRTVIRTIFDAGAHLVGLEAIALGNQDKPRVEATLALLVDSIHRVSTTRTRMMMIHEAGKVGPGRRDLGYFAWRARISVCQRPHQIRSGGVIMQADNPLLLQQTRRRLSLEPGHVQLVTK